MVDEVRFPAHPPTPQGIASQEPQRFLLMSPAIVGIGGLIAFFTVVLMVVILPITTYLPPISDNWLPLSNAAEAGRQLYVANGCVYCHSGFTRPQDVAVGQYYLYPRVADPGDYHGVDQAPNLLGSERTGPDLSQEGGFHPDDWHFAHYENPRNTQPLSIMPRFNFYDRSQLSELIAFNQESGGKDAVLRYATEKVGSELMPVNMGIADASDFFPDLVNQLKASGQFNENGSGDDMSPSGLPWMAVWMVNSFERGYWLTNDPLPLTQQNLLRGKQIFLERCTGCHGATGNGDGPATRFLQPVPFDFTNNSSSGMTGPFASDGMLYHRILTGGKGTAMENFGTRLSVEDTWRVVLFLRTVPNGSLAEQGTVPTVAMYQPWTPPPPLMTYIDSHPIDQGPGVINLNEDPFTAAAHWLAPGMAAGDMILVGGQLPMTQARLADLIRTTYENIVRGAYQDAVDRGEPALPPLQQVLDTSGLTFHGPA
jgi:cytochrome c oxidase cbb3-type subunit 2